MPPVRTQINCPNCKQPILAEVQQLFDVGQEPGAKQKLLSGAFNVTTCPHCGYNGMLAMPILYHDPQKELLLSYFPPELNMPRDEQEKAIGALLNQVVESLPQEQRKGYLFNPQQALTMKGLVERILQADGITPEMIEAQQNRLNLLQRMIDMSDDALEEVAKQEDEQIDADFFSLLGRLVEASLAAGDQETARKLSDLQQTLLPLTTFGRQLQEQSKEVEALIKQLQEAEKKGLTREKLLEIALGAADHEAKLSALVSLARPGLDYGFFQLLSERIEKAEGEEKERLSGLRENLLEMTRAIDQQWEARLGQARQNLKTLLEAENVAEATKQNLAAVDEFFLETLNREYEAAQRAGDQEKLGKLQQVAEVIQQASPGGREIALIQELLDAQDADARKEIMQTHRDQITPEFIETLTGLMVQLQDGKNQEMADKVRALYREAVRMSMQSGMAKEK